MMSNSRFPIDQFFYQDQLRALSRSESYSSSISSAAGTAKRIGYPKCNLDINIDNHFRSKIYTSQSPVTGNIIVTTKRDVRFDSMQIMLTGTTSSRVDGVQSRRAVKHTFLKMDMPGISYPVPRILEAGVRHTFPFNFVIPSQLTLNACSHRVSSAALRDQHTRLPPSLGRWEKDDMAPPVIKVRYAVTVRVYRQPKAGSSSIIMMESSQRIQVLPAAWEESPLSLTADSKLYKLYASKTFRKNFIANKLGRLTVHAQQPGAVFLATDGRTSSTATIHLVFTFKPASVDGPPPRITAISAKVVAHTFLGGSTFSEFPDRDRDTSLERYSDFKVSVSLPSVSEAGLRAARWELRGDYRSDSADTNTTSSSVCHVMAVDLPARLPVNKKIFIPTFHSCMASRVYVLQLSVSATLGSSPSTLSLHVPLQVAVEGLAAEANAEGLPSFEAAVGDAAADAFLGPRASRVTDQAFLQTTDLHGALPRYADLSGTRRS